MGDVVRVVAKLGHPSEVVVLYEAGSAGFSLYRQLNSKGYECKVIAPNSIPDQKGKKTDRNDAIGNFNYYVSGLLRFVWVPDAFTECTREALRYRFDLVHEQTAEKQKVQALLKRHDVKYTITKTAWTKKFWAWIKEVELPKEVRMVLDMQLERIENRRTMIDKLECQVMDYIKENESLAGLYRFYHVMTGMGRLGAMTWTLEGNDLNRFSHPGNLMSYLGLVPRKNSSGGRDPALSITKTGNAYLRYVTVVAARSYTDRRLTQRKDALKDLPEPVAQIITRCQDRLCNRYRDLRNNKKNGNKAKVAIARELCGFLWELIVKVMPITPVVEFAKAA
jgi:transposase